MPRGAGTTRGVISPGQYPDAAGTTSQARGKKKALVTGGAGFIGSHLCERLLSEGYQVLCVDNLLTGSRSNVSRLEDSSADFEYVEHDVTRRLEPSGKLDEVYHFASPASPSDFGRFPFQTLAAGSSGTHNCLELARTKGARFMVASTSEVYGDPLVHPQHEDYRGNVNQVGIRGAYDEAKRYAEALTVAYHRHRGVDTRIVRIFNTHGPGMRPDDGRMVPNFIRQALAGEPLTVYGDGSQTRGVQYVDDLIEGVFRLMRSRETRPVNIGNPAELSVREVSKIVLDISGSEGGITYEPLPEDDPKQRCPDITRAREVLGWEPQVPVKEGLRRTYEWFAKSMEEQR